MRVGVYWTLGILAPLVVLYLIYTFALTSPHCAEWQTIRQTTEAYTEYQWSMGQQKMVPVIHPEQTHFSYEYCSVPVR